MTTLTAFVRSPSSNQGIMKEEPQKPFASNGGSNHVNKRKQSEIRERNEAMIRLQKSGQQTQLQVARLSTMIGGKITTEQQLDKSTLKRMISKKGD